MARQILLDSHLGNPTTIASSLYERRDILLYGCKPLERYCVPGDSSAVQPHPVPIDQTPSGHYRPLPETRGRRFHLLCHSPSGVAPCLPCFHTSVYTDCDRR